MKLPKAMLSTLLGPLMLPFYWETADVHIMSPRVLSEVPVEMELGLVALRHQPQVQHMMFMDGCLLLIQKPKYTISHEQHFQHLPGKPKKSTVLRKHIHRISNNCLEQCQLGCC